MLCDREDIILKITEFGEEYFGGVPLGGLVP